MAKLTLFAAVDIGSSKIVMKIFQISKTEGISVIEECVCDVAIGRETFVCGKLSYEVIAQICACLEKFKRIMSDYGVNDCVCYATSAVREASNSEYIRDQIFIRTGLKISIASNEEERFIHHKALAFNMKNFDELIRDGALIIDISSGSLQISSYENSELKFSQNLPLGFMKIPESVNGKGIGTVSFSKLLSEYTSSVLNLYRESFLPPKTCGAVILIGSRIDEIRDIIGTDDDMVKRETIRGLYDEISNAGIHEFADKHNLTAEKSRQIFTSLLMFRSFIDGEKKADIYMPDVEMADGICVEYLEKNKFTHTKHIFTNDILSSAAYYAGRYNVNMAHVRKVTSFCEALFRALSKKFGLSKSDLVLLKVAAIYANTGFYININDYNVYSYSIKKSNKLLGLSNRDNDIISFIVLFQNGIFDHEEYRYLPKNRKLQIAKLASILSVAQSLDYEFKQKIDSITVSMKNGEVVINAVSSEDITIERWQFGESAKFLEEVLGIRATLKQKNC